MKHNRDNVQKGPERKDEINAKINYLRAIKDALSMATNPQEIRELIKKFGNIANAIPSDMLPAGLEFDDIKATYTDKIIQLERDMADMRDKDVISAEKAERVIVDIMFINKEINDFLNRDDIKASSKRNKHWADHPELLDPDAFLASHTKEREEELRLADRCSEVDVKIEALNKMVAQLSSSQANKERKEAEKLNKTLVKLLKTHIEQSDRLEERFSNKEQIFANAILVAQMGEAVAIAERKIYADRRNNRQRGRVSCERMLAERQAGRFSRRMGGHTL